MPLRGSARVAGAQHPPHAKRQRPVPPCLPTPPRLARLAAPFPVVPNTQIPTIVFFAASLLFHFVGAERDGLGFSTAQAAKLEKEAGKAKL